MGASGESAMCSGGPQILHLFFGQSLVESSQHPFVPSGLVRILYGEFPGRPGLPQILPFM